MLLHSNAPVSIRPGHFVKFLPWALTFLRNGTAKRVAEISEAMHCLNHSCIDLYRQHLAGTGHENLIRNSYYVHAYRDPQKANLDAVGYKIRLNKGADLERIGAEELRRLEPTLSDDFQAAILIKGQARAMAPGKIADVLAQKAQRAGACFTQANVQSLAHDPRGGWRITTMNGTFRSPKVVLAAGAWSAQLLRPLGINVPLEAERGYHVQFSDPGVELKNSIMDTDGMFVASSMLDGLRVAGTAEFAGLSAPINPKRIARLARQARRMLPDLNIEPMQSWAGIRPSLPDSLPVIGEIADHKGLYGAFGHAHYGLMMGPKTGEIIADLVSDRATNADGMAFQVSRFR